MITFDEIKRNYDFDDFVSSYRPTKADKHIKKQFAVDFELREVDGEGRVFARCKSSISDKTKWNAWTQMYPSLFDLRPHRPHEPTDIPTKASNNEWDDFEANVSPTLSRFVMIDNT